mmetsp:Transcript_13558/g.24174  ORF Transcript_13558/g.24174 Transcript_13558/m.24174 type:complete len:205 (+) Transcript_13558:654-1268(+)
MEGEEASMCLPQARHGWRVHGEGWGSEPSPERSVLFYPRSQHHQKWDLQRGLLGVMMVRAGLLHRMSSRGPDPHLHACQNCVGSDVPHRPQCPSRSWGRRTHHPFGHIEVCPHSNGHRCPLWPPDSLSPTFDGTPVHRFAVRLPSRSCTTRYPLLPSVPLFWVGKVSASSNLDPPLGKTHGSHCANMILCIRQRAWWMVSETCV